MEATAEKRKPGRPKKSETAVSPKTLTAAEYELLNQEMRELPTDDRDEEAKKARLRLGGILSRVRFEDIYPEQGRIVEIDVPLPAGAGPTQPYFAIGDRKFPPGTHRVPVHVAHQLAWLIDMNRRVDDDRLKDTKQKWDLGSTQVAQRIRMIAED